MADGKYLLHLNKNKRNLWKKRLTREEALAYEQIVEALATYSPTVQFRLSKESRLGAVLEAVDHDYPEYVYYFDRGKTSYVRVSGSGKNSVYEMSLKYYYSRAGVEQTMRYLEDFMDDYIYPYIEQKQCKSDQEIVAAIYECLSGMLTYSTEDQGNGRYPYYAYTLEILVRRTGVCKGVSQAMAFILNQFDIDCIYIVGVTEEGENLEVPTHAWNLICLDGTFYHMDLTWDLQKQQFQYFLLNDNEIQQKNHIWNPEIFPKAA